MSQFKRWRVLIALVVVVLLALPSAALAANISKGGKGGGGGGGGGGGETTLTNNLSVPAIFVPNMGSFTFTCDGTTLTLPSGTPLSGYEVPGYFYVQGVNKWQSQCQTAAAGTITANAAWGDNLTGATLKAGSPIRVEVGLLQATPVAMTGFDVFKLEPSLLDRNSAYGTLATETAPGVFESNPVTPFPEVRVWDANATLSIKNLTTSAYVYNGPAAAEINATGRVVYGFNWGTSSSVGLPTAGTYLLTFAAPNVTIAGVNVGTVVDAHTVTLQITVAGTSGGGTGGKGGKG